MGSNDNGISFVIDSDAEGVGFWDDWERADAEVPDWLSQMWEVSAVALGLDRIPTDIRMMPSGEWKATEAMTESVYGTDGYTIFSEDFGQHAVDRPTHSAATVIHEQLHIFFAPTHRLLESVKEGEQLDIGFHWQIDKLAFMLVPVIFPNLKDFEIE
jgi:hypothetical protein